MAEIFDESVVNAAFDRYQTKKFDPREELQEAISCGKPAALNELDELPRFVNRFVQLGRPDLAAELLETTTKGEVQQVSALERVIAQNELMSIAFFSRGLRAARAVGRIVIRESDGTLKGHGTGFMVSPKLLLTNNHVLATPSVAARSTIQFDHALGPGGEQLPVKEFRLDPNRFFETHDRSQLDFTIVAVANENDDGEVVKDRGWISLLAKSGKAITGEPLNIIQHPAGELLQIAIRENEALGPNEDYFIYTTDTKQGSSGSPVLNDQWQVAALHHAGVPNKDESGNWLRKDGQPYRRGIDDPATIQWIANEGVRISRIVSNMNARNLSPEKQILFREVLETVTPVSTPQETVPMQRPGPSSEPSAGGSQIGPDGIARWNFQLTFGPAGGPAPDLARSPTPSILETPATPEPAVRTSPDSLGLESVFERRGDYYDKAADQAAADQYFGGISAGLNKTQRYKALNELLTDTHRVVLSYSKARHEHLYPWIDRREDETLQSVYSGQIMAEELFVAELRAFESAIEMIAADRGFEASALPDEQLEEIDISLESSSAFNCEHVVPQSWFADQGSKRAQKSDLHHLFTCESGCNSFRSNIPYSEFTPEEEAGIRAQEISLTEALQDPSLEAARPNCGLRDGRRFEPTAGKGAVARATLYFVLRYPGAVGDVKSGSKKEFVKSNVNLLLDWADAEAPSLHEKHRNAEIAKVQGNRNPLIDRPEWLHQIKFERGFG